MALNISKLQNVKKKADGSIIAGCPACQAAGGDTKGEHLMVYPDGKYGCVANPKVKAHTKQIFDLVGEKHTSAPERITVKTVKIPESKVIMDLGKFSRFARTRTPVVAAPPVVVVQTHPVVQEKPAPAAPRGFLKGDDVTLAPEEYNTAYRADTEEEAMAFLNAKAA